MYNCLIWWCFGLSQRDFVRLSYTIGFNIKYYFPQ